MMKKKKGGGGGANWMDTYGDMVTLLLCFFVMLYSMSRVDESKWAALVASFHGMTVDEPSQVVVDGALTDTPVEGLPSGLTQDMVDESLEQLYLSISQSVTESGLDDMVSVTKGSGYVFVSFDDAVFFDGNSYELRDEGKVVLDDVAKPLAEASQSINEVRVLGHTAQADPNRQNYVDYDRFLASNRATVVTIYLQEKNVIDPARLISVGYGQWRPVFSNDTPEGQAHNRRVELVISGLNLESEEGDSVSRYYTMRDGASQ